MMKMQIVLGISARFYIKNCRFVDFDMSQRLILVRLDIRQYKGIVICLCVTKDRLFDLTLC